MATKRRGSGGFKPTDLGGTLGGLLRSALQQASGVRDVLERTRSRVDTFRTNQKRQDALAELGEIVLDLVRRGEIDVAELPEAKDAIRYLDEVDAADSSAHAHDHDHDHPHDHDHQHEPTLPASRSRFDARGPKSDDDGTVGSAKWSPPRAAKPTAVWRPPVTAEPPPPAPTRKGGISFDTNDDDDLAEYMHPDDVPPKGSASDE